jgi:hypothetical protein
MARRSTLMVMMSPLAVPAYSQAPSPLNARLVMVRRTLPAVTRSPVSQPL